MPINETNLYEGLNSDGSPIVMQIEMNSLNPDHNEKNNKNNIKKEKNKTTKKNTTSTTTSTNKNKAKKN